MVMSQRVKKSIETTLGAMALLGFMFLARFIMGFILPEEIHKMFIYVFGLVLLMLIYVPKLSVK